MDLKAFQGEEHLPFRLVGETGMAVLLIHGFPGTPAELRPLANIIHGSGLTVEVPLLPGFGNQIETLPIRSYGEWISSVRGSLANLQSSHDRVVVIGFSMGAALAIHAAVGPHPPDGLILLAPFWQLGERWHQPFWPLLRMLLREFRPFEKADFDDPAIRRELRRSMPDADLDHPGTIEAIRKIAFPFRVLDQLRRLGRETWRVAPLIEIPLLVLQGRQDSIVPPARTRRLIDRFPSEPEYIEVDADHQLINRDGEAWARIVTILTDRLQVLTRAAEE